MPSFAACLYGSALYTPDPSGVRCFFEDCCESRFHLSRGSLLTSAYLWVPEWSPHLQVSSTLPKSASTELSEGGQGTETRYPVSRIRCARVDPERGSDRRNKGVGLMLTIVDPPRSLRSHEIGRRTLQVGTRLIAQLHKQRAHHLLDRPLVLRRKLLPSAPNLPLPERPSHPEEVLLHHSHRSLLYLHPQLPSHPLHRQSLGLGTPPSLSPHQVLELDHRRPSLSLPPQELPVALIERLKLASAQLSAPDGD